MKKKMMATLTAAAMLMPLVPAVSFAGGSVIGFVSVDGFVEPVLGQTGVEASALSVPDSSNYLIETANWYMNDGAQPLTGDWTFEAGNSYKLVVILGTEDAADDFIESGLDGLLNGGKEYIGWCDKLAGGSGQAALQTVNFTMTQPSLTWLSGYAWRDVNKNGVRPYFTIGDMPNYEPENETVVEGMVISVYDIEGQLIADGETASDGSYGLQLPYGTYTVKASLPAKYSDYTFTVPENGAVTKDFSEPNTVLDIGIVKDDVSGDLIEPATPEPTAEAGYGLRLKGVEVTSENKDDILGDGLFSYDSGKKVLTLGGSLQDMGLLLSSTVDGLTVNVTGDVSLKTSYDSTVHFAGSTTITGGGSLTIGGVKGWQEAKRYGITVGTALTLDHANIILDGDYGILGGSDAELNITASSITSTSALEAITGFDKGVTLKDCKFTSPAGGYFKDGKVCDAEGNEITKFVIEPMAEENTDTPPTAAPKQSSELNHPFSDVPENSYYEKGVAWAYTNGVTTGTTATMFSPEDTCTRGQVVTFLWRAAGSPAPENVYNPFKDVSADDYYYKPILWAVEKGITAGTTAETFSPELTCSSAHIITFLYRAMGKGDDGWYEDAKNWAKENGLLSDTGLVVSPDEPCPRGAVVTFLERVYNGTAD